MIKIYMRTVHEDNGVTKTFGTDMNVQDWKKEQKSWEEEGFCCDNDSIEEIGQIGVKEDIYSLIETINMHTNWGGK